MILIIGNTLSGKTKDLYSLFAKSSKAILFVKYEEHQHKLKETQNIIKFYDSGEELLEMIGNIKDCEVFIDDIPDYIGSCYIDRLKELEISNSLEITMTLQANRISKIYGGK